MRVIIKHLRYVSKCIIAICLLHVQISPALGQSEDEVAAQIIAIGGAVVKDAKGRVRDVDLFLVPDASVERINFESLKGLKSVHIGSKTTSDRTLVRLQMIPPGLEHIRIGSAQITDDALIDLLHKQRKSIRYVALTGTTITDKSLVEIGQLKELWHLGLNKTKITDKGVKEIVDLPKLRSLHLRDIGISDDGLKDVAKLKGLEFLILDGTKITDRGIQELGALKNLKLLGVNLTAVTEEGKAALKAVLPRVEFAKKFEPRKK